MPEKNNTLFRRIRNHLLRFPEAYSQRFYGRRSKLAPCGTQACIAGRAFLLSGGDPEDLLAFQRWLNDLIDDKPRVDIVEDAGKVLGLSDIEAGVLFGFGTWPRAFQKRFNKARGVEKARVAADYINHIIRTGSVTEASDAPEIGR